MRSLRPWWNHGTGLVMQPPPRRTRHNDCRSTSCGGERTFAISDQASFYKDRTVGEVLRLMRCSRGCGGRALAAWLETGPILNQRVRPRRVPLVGLEARE